MSDRMAKKPWKEKGRKPIRKSYQDYCRLQHKSGKCASGNGGWTNVSSLGNQNIRTQYEKNFGVG